MTDIHFSDTLEDALQELMMEDAEYVLLKHVLSKDESIGEHHHPLANEWVIYSAGTLEITIDGELKRTTVENTTCVKIPAGAKHTLHCLTDVSYLVLRDRSDETVYTSRT
jgi:quercetin dioxygenase-like cupin family protein